LQVRFEVEVDDGRIIGQQGEREYEIKEVERLGDVVEELKRKKGAEGERIAGLFLEGMRIGKSD